MIRPLRTYHFIIWRLLAMGLPLAFVLAILWRPAGRRSPIKEFSKDFEASLFLVNDSTAQVRILVLNPLDAPACVAEVEIGNHSFVLGKLSERKEYRFTIPARHLGKVLLHLNDPIRKKEIDSFVLTITTDRK